MKYFLAPTGKWEALWTAFSQREGGCSAGGWGGKIHIFAWHLDPVHRIQSKFGMDILLDPRNKPAKEFFHFFQNTRWPPAVKNFRRVILFFSHFKLPPHQRALWTFVGATNWRVNYWINDLPWRLVFQSVCNRPYPQYRCVWVRMFW